MTNRDPLQARIEAARARVDAALDRYNNAKMPENDEEAAQDAAHAALLAIDQAEWQLNDAIEASLSPMNRLPRALNAQGLFVSIAFPPGESSEVEVVVMRGNWIIAVERDVDALAAMRRAYDKAGGGDEQAGRAT